MSHRINSDSNDENEEHNKPFWIQIITTMKKSVKQTNLERKNNWSQRETGDTRNIIEPQYFTKLRQVQWITYTSVLHILPKPN